jgi:hypothetical protein
MPKGKGAPLHGTYTGPSTLHYEQVDPTYYVRSKDFFHEGRVFAVIISESAGHTHASKQPITAYNSSESIDRVPSQNVYTSIRRFIVVRQKREFCYACPIYTYAGRATMKPGVNPSEHGMAYSWGQDPQLLPGEEGIRKLSVAVATASGEPSLGVASRIYYGIHHPVQYNVKVKDIGYVPQEHIPTLIRNWREEDNGSTEQEYDITATGERGDEDEQEGEDDDDEDREDDELYIVT